VLRVLHVIPSISRRRGGPSVAVLEMVAALRQRGVDARILTTNDDGPGLLEALPTGIWTEWEGVPVLAFPRWSPPLAPVREFAFSPDLNRWLSAHIREFDLLHVHALFSWPSTSAMAQARRAGVPYVLRTIGQLNRWSLKQSSRRKKVLLGLIERRNLQGAASLHFTSDAEREEVSDLGLSSPPIVLPLGVCTDVAACQLDPVLSATPAPGPSSRSPESPTAVSPTVFLFLSRLHPKKQLENLLDAFALLQQAQPEAAWILQIAGDGDPAYVASLHQRAQSLQIADRLLWLGFVEGELKWRTLAAADWFVLPSASENFGIAAIESLAAGTPVILSPGVAVASDITQAGAGRLCDPVPERLALALRAALAGPGEAMRRNARNLVRSSYSWPAIADRLHVTYTSLLASSR